jgi:hypothetical protein
MIASIYVLDILNACVAFITAICATYLAYMALKHSAKPRAIVIFEEPFALNCNETGLLKFKFKNIGHWYAQPMIVNMTVFINFDEYFEPIEIRFGSIQEIIESNVRIGKGNMKFLKAKGIKLGYNEYHEEVHVLTKAPEKIGSYKIKVDAYSDNGLDLSQNFYFNVI